jgi:hypothetical protein
MRALLRGIAGSAMLVVSVGASGCGGGPTSPGEQPQIVNSVDNFQYQVSNVAGFSGTQSYTWQNSGATATVNQASSISAGSVTLVMLDANGVQVYSRSLADNGTFSSASGAPGAWTIRVVYSNATATVNFRSDKAT